MTLILLLIVLCLMVAGGFIPAIMYYDKIIDYLYRYEHDLWVKVGSPAGFFRKPAVPKKLLDSSAQIFSIKLLYNTPSSFYSNDVIRVLVRKYKIHCAIWIIGVLCSFVLVNVIF